MTSTLELYGMSNEELQTELYNAIIGEIYRNHDNLTTVQMATASENARFKKRIDILTKRRNDLLKNGFIPLTKEEDTLVSEVVEAITFWKKLKEY